MALGVDFGVILTPKIDQKSMLKFDRFSDAFWKGSGAALSNYHAIDLIQLENLGPLGEGRVGVGSYLLPS
mgnify:CR=1 FL=1